MCLTSLVSCSGGSGDRYDPDACTSFILPTSFGLGWRNVNHRVSLWQMRLEPGPDEGGCPADALDVAFIGGDFSTGAVMSDTPRYDFGFQRVDAGAPAVLGAARKRIEMIIGPEGIAEGTVTLSREDLSLTGYERILAFVEGLRLATDIEQGPEYPDNYDPAHGYTSRGLGVRVGVEDAGESADAAADVVKLEYRVRFQHGTSDRKDMNEAMVHAITAASLDVLLVGYTGLQVLEGGVDYTVSSPMPVPLEDVPSVHAAVEDTRVSLTGPQGPFRGLYGLTGFDFFLEPGEEEGAGYYLRDLVVDLALDDYDSVSGQAGFLFEGYASNATKFIAFYALNSHFQGTMAWIPAAVETETYSMSQEFETGSAEFPIP